MSSRRCPECDIRYPYSFVQCPRHPGPQLAYDSFVRPDPDWEQRVAKLLLNDEHQTLGIHPLRHAVPVRFDSEKDAYFIRSVDVVNAGITSRLQPDTLIKNGERVYEVLGYTDRTREYWVRPFVMTAEEMTDEAIAAWLAD